MKNIKTEIKGKMTIDPDLDERYGKESLFPQKIERIKSLLKGTKFDPASSKVRK